MTEKKEVRYPIRRTYTKEQWEIIRKRFQKDIPGIMLDSDMTSADIKMTIGKIDELLPTALMINSYIKTDFENIENKFDSLKKSLTYDNKIGSRRSDHHKNFTDAEAKGLAYKELREGKKVKVSTGPGEDEYEIRRERPNEPTIEELRALYNERYNFMYAIVASLRSKKEVLVTYGSMLKMESQI